MGAKVIEKPKRSVELSPAQKNFLKKVVKKSPSVTEAGIRLGISKDVLSRTLAFGSCSEKTYHILFPRDSQSLKEDIETEAADAA